MAETSRRYDGFVSYSHQADGLLAPALQRGMQQLAKPWSKRRALEVFRDDTGLSVNPDLWASIETALDASQWFVLLASPESARSDWVGQEIAHWVHIRGVDGLLVVVTDGTWAWDDAAGEIDFARSSAAHPELRGVFRRKTTPVDLSWARTDTHLTLRNARFRDLVAEIAAPLHGRSREELEREDVRQKRRTRRIIRGAVAALATLALLASAGGVAALNNAREAVRQRDAARQQARMATAANLATRSAAADRTDLSLKILLALQSYRLIPNPTNEAAVRAALDTDVTGVLHGPRGGVVDISIGPGGTRAAAVDGTGAVHVWDLALRSLVLSSDARVAVKADWLGESNLLISDDAGRISTLDITDGSLQPVADGARVLTDAVTGLAHPVMAANPTAGYGAYLRDDGLIAVLDGDGAPRYEFQPARPQAVVDLVLTSDGRLIGRTDGIEVWQLAPTGPPVGAAAPQDPVATLEPVSMYGGLALSLDEERVSWQASNEYDARTGEQLFHRQCIPIVDTFRPSATTYVGGTDSAVFWDTGFAASLGSSAGVPGAACAPGEQNQNFDTAPSEVATGFAVPGNVMWSLAGRSDGLLLAGGSSGAVVLLRFGAYSTRTDLGIDELLGVGCHVAGRNLTAAEWTAYLPGATPEPICGAWAAFAEGDASPFADGGGPP